MVQVSFQHVAASGRGLRAGLADNAAMPQDLRDLSRPAPLSRCYCGTAS
jgi:hypothetical protein